MKGIFVNCPNCKKMLLKNAYLRVGSYFQLYCAKCGAVVSLKAEIGKVIAKVERREEIIVDDDEEDTVFFSTS